ncbi:Oidioi.mRNA.OKI2018_I69.XSR.g15820.t1.cds [Oikopleura dioica]|uniref:Oidioi.mRNA.OKI2018_I69.XSR.g15820.t1.cds n=1 Tax=Oikopleura dioica TaxID=34765 RepID=A0ABN7SE06_OIKDI|nr:Oidioi.mRNA.OKI2018_I69.XSR.g15820.t1.cds [Oikopleura dioica]
MEEFDRIISLIAGPKEKNRAAGLKEYVNVVEDEISERIASLPSSARISDRAKIAFGTGETHKAITVSSNTGFIRAAKQQDVFVSVKEHRPRALSEQKEPAAVLLSRDSLSSDFDIDYFAQIFTA